MHTKKGRRQWLTASHAVLIAVVGTGLAAGGSAVASDPQAATGTASAKAKVDDTVVIVTARRKQENAQKVPIAIDAVSQTQLQANGVADLNGLQQLIPSMSSVTQTFSRDTVNVDIRGQGVAYGGSPGVEAYIDEVPIPTQESGDLTGGPGQLFDLDNVAVLKGPQGTLFGKNVVGGAVLLQTEKPQDEFGGHIQVGYGSYDNREIDGAVDMPIIPDKLLTRFAFSGDLRDGYTTLLASPSHPNGEKVDDRDYWSVRESLSYIASDQLRNDTVLGYSRYEDHSAAFELASVNPAGLIPGLVYGNSTPSFSTLLAEQQALGPRTLIPQSVDPISRGNILYLTNTTKVGLSDNISFRNILGYIQTNYVATADADSTQYAALDVLALPYVQNIDQFSDEAQLQGKSFAGKLDWTTGVFYLTSKNPAFQLETQQVFSGPDTYQDLQHEDSSLAFYGQGNYDLSSWLSGLSLTLGLRYTDDYKALLERTSAPGNTAASDCASTPRVNCDTIYKLHVRLGPTTWTVGLNYQVDPNTLLYLTSRRGYRMGGFNTEAGGTGIVNLENFGPEYVTDLEAGIKSDWHLGSIPVRTNADIYGQDWSDIQISQTQVFASQNEAEIAVTANAGDARQVGFEFESTFRLTQALTLGVDYDYLNLKYTKFAANVDPSQAIEDLKLNRPPQKYGVSLRYKLPVDEKLGSMNAQANWSWQATSGVVDEPGTSIPAYGLLNLTFNWERINGSRYDLQIYDTNATNKLYVAGSRPLEVFGFTSVLYGEPQMYGIRLKYHFGGEAN